jgi:hypothetical protein
MKQRNSSQKNHSSLKQNGVELPHAASKNLEWFYFILTLLAFAVGILATRTDIVDPDGLFHIAISRMMLKDGIVHAIPQLDQLSWGTHFVDKEFFYHVLSSIAYGLGGEEGFKGLTILLNGIFAWSLYDFLKSRGISPKTRFFLLLLVAAQASFMFRISTVRPLVLSITLYTLNLLAILRRRTWLVILTSLLLPLSYHVLYLIPLNLFLAFIFFKDYRKPLLWGLTACAVGILIHPYFPDNISIFITQIESGLIPKDIPLWLIPAEFFQPPFSASWQVHLCFVSLLGLFIANRRSLLDNDQREMQFALVLTVIWYATLFVNYRALEYAFPVWFVAFCLLFLCLRGNLTMIVVTGLLLTCEIYATLENTPWRGFQVIPNFLATNKTVIDKIPVEAKGSTVLNCFWNQGNPLLYHRPDLKLIDLIDPIFFFKTNPQLFNLRESLNDGKERDPHAVIATKFHAKYFLCEFGPINMQLELDPRFQRLYPSSLQFKINFKENSVDSTDLSLYQIDERSARTFVSFRQDAAQSKQDCSQMKIDAADILARKGSVFLGFGMNYRIEQASVIVNDSVIPLPNALAQSTSILDVLVPLPHALEASDQVSFKWCGEPGEPTASLWTFEDIVWQCQIKANTSPMFHDLEFSQILHHKFPKMTISVCDQARALCKKQPRPGCEDIPSEVL